MTKTQQNLLNLAILIVIAILFIWFDPQGPGKTVGIYLPQTDTSPKAISVSDVKVYDAQPAHYKLLGLINTSKHWDKVNDKINKAFHAEAKQFAIKQAAAHGANGIILLQESAEGNAGSPLNSWASQWAAITTTGK